MESSFISSAAGTTAAQIPTSFSHELRACLRCHLIKTYNQVHTIYPYINRSIIPKVAIRVLLYQISLFVVYLDVFKLQFRESGCENCPFFREYDSKKLLKENLKRLAGIDLQICSAQVRI
ncbi:putative transcription initiation Spt4, Spt4 superfamily [Helianthus debilis subsp. tardiflorus]